MADAAPKNGGSTGMTASPRQICRALAKMLMEPDRSFRSSSSKAAVFHGGKEKCRESAHVRCSGSHAQIQSLGPTRSRHYLHGERGQPSIWLDAVRAADPASMGMDQGRNPDRVFDLYPVGDLARSV
jgi:hypothetical protein